MKLTNAKLIVAIVTILTFTAGVWAVHAVQTGKAQDTFGTAIVSTALQLTFGTANTVPYLNGSKELVSSAVTPTTLGYLDATSSIQTQLNAKAPIDSPSFTTLLDLDFATGNLALATNAAGNVVEVAGVSDTEVGYIGGLTSDAQTQLDAKAPATSPTISTSMILDYGTAYSCTFLNATKQVVSGVHSIVAAANQACSTTCTATKVCIFGWDTAAGEVAVECTDATADKCLCLGAP